MNGMTSFGRMPMRKSMSMPMAPPAARLRHRKSLQEDEHSKSFSFSFAKRRVERQSSLASTPQGVEVALLDRVQVEFVKAVLPANKMASTRYVMRVASAAMNQSWEMSRTFREFYELKEDIVRALDHGHFCKSNCPWVYMYVTHHFPRRHVFRSRSPSVISNRISELQTFMSTVLGMWKENRSLECAVSGSRLPHLLYEFLFQGMVLDFGDINNFAAANGVDRGSLGASSIGGSFLDNGGARVSDEECSICQRSLVTPDTSITIAPPSSSNKENSSRSNASNASSSEDTCESYSTAETVRSSEQIMASLTTLQCGHCFHDECILAKLNESLVCPRCAVPAAH